MMASYDTVVNAVMTTLTNMGIGIDVKVYGPEWNGEHTEWFVSAIPKGHKPEQDLPSDHIYGPAESLEEATRGFVDMITEGTLSNMINEDEPIDSVTGEEHPDNMGEDEEAETMTPTPDNWSW